MKKALVMALALLFTVSTTSLVLADGTAPAKKSHKGSKHKKGGKKGGAAAPSTAAPATTK